MRLRPSPFSLALSLIAFSVVADAAPVTQQQPRTSPVQPSPGIAPMTGTLLGGISLQSPLADPTWKGACTDVTVVARPASGNPLSVKATGDVATKKCSYSFKVPVGTWTVEAQVDGKSVLAGDIGAPRVITKDQTAEWNFAVTFPTYAVGVVRATADITGSGLQCSQLQMKVVHAAKTVQAAMTFKAGANLCFAERTNVVGGPITVSIIGGPTLPSQTATSDVAAVVNLAYVFPKFATVRVRLRPASYPAMQSPQIDCGPYAVVVKKDGAVVTTATQSPGANSSIECSIQTNSLHVPAGVPLVLELTKAGSVVRTEPLGPLTPSQFFEKVYQPLP